MTKNRKQLQGYFVDNCGFTRLTSKPGYGLHCTIENDIVDIIDASGCTVLQAEFHASLESIESRGVVVKFAHV